MIPESKLIEEIEQAYHVARNLMLDGKMEKRVYFKCLLSLAHDYAALGKTEDAVALIAESNESYLRHDMPLQQADDPLFGQVVTALALMLKAANVRSQPVEEDLDEALFLSLGTKGKA